MKATVCQFSDGQIRMFDSMAAALAWEAGQPEDVGIVGSVEVEKEKHYRGACGPNGIRFSREDQSTPQLVAALANEG